MCKHTSETRVCRCRDLPILTGSLSDRGTAHLVCQIAGDAALSGHMHQSIDRTPFVYSSAICQARHYYQHEYCYLSGFGGCTCRSSLIGASRHVSFILVLQMYHIPKCSIDRACLDTKSRLYHRMSLVLGAKARCAVGCAGISTVLDCVR